MRPDNTPRTPPKRALHSKQQVAAEASAEETSHGQEDQLAEIQEKHPLPDKHACFDSCFGEAQRELKEPRLFFAPNVVLSIVVSWRRELASVQRVSREWRGSVEAAKGLRMYKRNHLRSVVAVAGW